MIIDVRTKTSGKYGKQLTVIGAIGDVIDTIPVGGSCDVHGIKDHLGNDVPLQRINMAVNKLKGDRVFTIKTVKSGVGAIAGVRIWRIK